MATNKKDTNSNEQQTAYYGADDTAKTGIQGSNTTNENDGINDAPTLQPGQELQLNSTTYQVIQLISNNSLEAKIYKIKNNSDEVFALKLYHHFADPNKEPNAETLSRIKSLKDANILHLYDFGIGSQKYLSKYCFEISAFAKGGDMFSDPNNPGQRYSLQDFKQKYSIKFIEKTVVPALVAGIKKLHENNIIHCDLKPGNIFFRDTEKSELQIGDYGSSKSYHNSAEPILTTTTHIQGTPFFYPPEHSFPFYSPKTDYYSLGAILLQLLYPEQISASDEEYWNIDTVKKQKISLLLTNGDPPIPFSPKPAFQRLNQLIHGLLQSNLKTRFGPKEVELWLQGKEVFVGTTNIPPLKIRDQTIYDEAEFIQFIRSQPRLKEVFKQDATTSALIKQWVQQHFNQSKRELMEGLIQSTANRGERYLKEALLRCFKPDLPIQISENDYLLYNVPDIRHELSICLSDIDQLWKTADTKNVVFPLFQIELCLLLMQYERKGKQNQHQVNIVLDTLYAAIDHRVSSSDSIPNPILNQSLELTDEKLIRLFYAFNSTRGFRISNGQVFDTIEQIAYYFAGNPSQFELPANKAELTQFIQQNNLSAQTTTNLSTFLLLALKQHVNTDLKLNEVDVAHGRYYRIAYTLTKSLKSHLQGKDIQYEYTDQSTKTGQFEYIRNLFETSASVYSKFIWKLKSSHDVVKLDDQQVRSLRNYFLIQVYAQYIPLYFGQFIALLLLIPLTLFTIPLLTKQVRLDHHWNFNTSPAYVTPELAFAERYDTLYTSYYKVTYPSNLRIGPSKRDSILTTLPVGEELLLLDDTHRPWIHIEYQGKSAYIHENLIVLLRQDTTQVRKFH